MTAADGPGGRAALVVMAKRPSPGRTKSRLTPPFSPKTAAQLYECFLHDALDLAQSIPGVTPVIAYSPVDAAGYFQQHFPDFLKIPQTGASLGARLDSVLTHCLQSGFKTVAAINSDSPTLPAAYLVEAFSCLADPQTDIVLGPCEDGGYYLIGWKRPHPALVRAVKMSTRHVLQDTQALAAAQGLQVALTPTWYDIDTLADLARLAAELAFPATQGRHTQTFFAENWERIRGRIVPTLGQDET